MSLKENIVRGAYKTKLSIKKASPTILIITGGLIGVAAIVDYCKQSIDKAAPVVEKTKQVINHIENKTEEEYIEEITMAGHELDMDDGRVKNFKEAKQVVISDVKKETAIKLAKIYARPVCLTITAAFMIGGSHYILKKRNIALAAAFKAVDTGFKMYRQRVVERFGEEVDRELRYNIKKHTVEEKYIDPETGIECVTKSEVDAIEVDPNDPNYKSIYARFFDSNSREWTKSNEYNLAFLKARQEEANMLLRRKGYLFLNTVYNMLDIPESKAGQVVGWTYNKDNPDSDNFVDFGLYNIYKPENRDFVNGYERCVLLDFNVEGNILEYLS